MKNGQLKPGYNLQLGVEGEFIVTAGLFSERSDTLTLLPLLEHLQEKTGKLPDRLIADSGYESEENYTRLEEMGVEAYIKLVNYEISKTRKYQRNRYKAENMPYDEETDSFTCPNGNTLAAIGTAHRKSKSGFLSEVTLHPLIRIGLHLLIRKQAAAMTRCCNLQGKRDQVAKAALGHGILIGKHAVIGME